MNISTLKVVAGVALLTLFIVLPTTATTGRMAPTEVDGISTATPVETPVKKKKDKTKKQKQKRKSKKQTTTANNCI